MATEAPSCLQHHPHQLARSSTVSRHSPPVPSPRPCPEPLRAQQFSPWSPHHGCVLLPRTPFCVHPPCPGQVAQDSARPARPLLPSTRGWRSPGLCVEQGSRKEAMSKAMPAVTAPDDLVPGSGHTLPSLWTQSHIPGRCWKVYVLAHGTMTAVVLQPAQNLEPEPMKVLWRSPNPPARLQVEEVGGSPSSRPWGCCVHRHVSSGHTRLSTVCPQASDLSAHS